jgi:hypothetical protein
MNLPRAQKSVAFTLLEIMVAIALLCLIIVAIYSSWNSIVKGSRVGLDAAAAAQRTRITMRTVHDALLCACMFNASATNYSFVADSSGDFSTLSFVAHLPKSFPRNGKFGDLTTRRLNFSVENEPDSNAHRLVLRQRPLIMDFDKDEMNFPLVLARDVTKFIVEYSDPQTGDWISDWKTSNALPREVRITLGLGHLDQYSSHPQDVMVGVVALPSVPVLLQWQMPQLGPGAGGGTNGSNVLGGGARGPGVGINPGQKAISIPPPQ